MELKHLSTSWCFQHLHEKGRYPHPSRLLKGVMAPDFEVTQVRYQGIAQCEERPKPHVPKISYPSINLPPMPRNQVDHLNVTAGTLLVYKVPDVCLFYLHLFLTTLPHLLFRSFLYLFVFLLFLLFRPKFHFTIHLSECSCVCETRKFNFLSWRLNYKFIILQSLFKYI